MYQLYVYTNHIRHPPRTTTTQRLERAGDAASAATLKHNAKQEEGHVAVGLKWFGWLAVRLTRTE